MGGYLRSCAAIDTYHFRYFLILVRACSKIHAQRGLSISQILTEKGLLSFYMRIFMVLLGTERLFLLTIEKNDGLFGIISWQFLNNSPSMHNFCYIFLPLMSFPMKKVDSE